MTLGLVHGIVTQVLILSAGLGALIAASATAFAALKWIGVGYLVVLGIQQWPAPGHTLGASTGDKRPVRRRRLVLRGWMLNAVNPKGTIFMLAVVPQFVAPAHVGLGLNR